MRVIMDAEGDDLFPTRIWCAVCKDVDTDEIHTFRPEDFPENFLKFASKVTLWIGHNVIDWDFPSFERLYGLVVPIQQVEDTLVMSRLAKPQRLGGHSIENWGRILGKPKREHEDWSQFSDDMLERCLQDVNITHDVWKRLKKALSSFSPGSIRMEHKIAQLLAGQERYGFKLDMRKATTLLAELNDQETFLREQILKDFKPKPKLIREVTPKFTKDGRMSKVGLKNFNLEEVEGPFSMVEFEEFNLGSPSQIVERLNKAGWSPVERTDGYKKALEKRKSKKITEEEFEEISKKSWKVSERNLETIHETAPESAKNLARWKMVASRKTLVETWIDLVDSNDRIHGQVNSLGTWTHRMSHYNPNMANIPGIKHDDDDQVLYGVEGAYGFECRDCWTTEEGRILLGVDAKGIQLRALAHYVNNPEYSEKVVSGDPHQYHADLLAEIVQEHIPRDRSKRFIYSYLLGAGNDKVSTVLGVPRCGKTVKEKFPQYLPGLDDLMKRLDEDAEKGYFKALDGRLIKLPSRHKALAGFLQSFETIIMRRAWCFWDKDVRTQGFDARNVAIVHDEFQIDTKPSIVDKVGNVVISAIQRAGEAYDTKCPMDGDAKWGRSWAMTH